MRTSLILQDDLIKQAQEATGVREKTALVHMGLMELVRKAARERLIKLGGTDVKAKAGTRRRSRRP